MVDSTQVFFSSGYAQVLEKRYVLLDTDFISGLHSDEIFLKEFMQAIQPGGCNCLIDPLVSLEFLRDIFIPRLLQQKEEFLNSEYFFPIPDHQEVFKKIKTNAQILSKIYGHKYGHEKKQKGISTVDLLLASRMTKLPDNSLIATGNIQDYPSCIFDLKVMITVCNLKND